MENKYEHSFSNVLNFSNASYACLDEAISLFFETYVSTNEEYVRLVIHKPKNEIDIYSIDRQYLLNFVKYGLNLIDGGLCSEALEMLLKNAYEVALDKCHDPDEKNLLRLQLLYIMQSIRLLHLGNIDDFLSFTNQLASKNIEMGKIYNHFNR